MKNEYFGKCVYLVPVIIIKVTETQKLSVMFSYKGISSYKGSCG